MYSRTRAGFCASGLFTEKTRQPRVLQGFILSRCDLHRMSAVLCFCRVVYSHSLPRAGCV